jgi:hypothetical protein
MWTLKIPSKQYAVSSIFFVVREAAQESRSAILHEDTSFPLNIPESMPVMRANV